MTRKQFITKTTSGMRRSIRDWLAMKPGDPLEERIELRYELAAKAQAGYVAMIESGMDCDCVQYSGRIHMVRANVVAYIAAVERAHSNAEGPISLYMVPPSAATRVRYTSRDLAMEAFENGNAYAVRG